MVVDGVVHHRFNYFRNRVGAIARFIIANAPERYAFVNGEKWRILGWLGDAHKSWTDLKFRTAEPGHQNCCASRRLHTCFQAQWNMSFSAYVGTNPIVEETLWWKREELDLFRKCELSLF